MTTDIMTATLNRTARYTINHPRLHLPFNCRIATVSECQRYVKVVLLGMVENYTLDDAAAEAAEAAVGEDWIVGVEELHER